MMDIEIKVLADTPREQVDEARRRLGSLERYSGGRALSARLAFRRGASPHARRPYVAEASLLLDGRVLAAHAVGPTALEAADTAIDRLRRQVRRIVGAEVAQRNEPEGDLRRAEPAPEPAEERPIVRRRTYTDRPLATLEAIAELLDMDVAFLLFRHVRTAEDVVVDRHHERIELIFPPGSVLADEGDLVAARPSRYPGPLTLVAALEEMDLVRHSFLYFVDAHDDRGKVLYQRRDGAYGLVETA